MQLWLFQFTQPDRRFVSARVAAWSKQQACDLIGNLLGRPLEARPYQAPEPGTILSAFGRVDVAEPAILAIDGAEVKR